MAPKVKAASAAFAALAAAGATLAIAAPAPAGGPAHAAADQGTLCRAIIRNDAGTMDRQSFDKGSNDRWVDPPPPKLKLTETWRSSDPDGGPCRARAVYQLMLRDCTEQNECLYKIDVALRRDKDDDRLVPDVDCSVNSTLISCNKLEQDFVEKRKLLVTFSLCVQGNSCTRK